MNHRDTLMYVRGVPNVFENVFVSGASAILNCVRRMQ